MGIQLELLCARRRISSTGEFIGGIAVRIDPTVKQVDACNDTMTAENEKIV